MFDDNIFDQQKSLFSDDSNRTTINHTLFFNESKQNEDNSDLDFIYNYNNELDILNNFDNLSSISQKDITSTANARMDKNSNSHSNHKCNKAIKSKYFSIEKIPQIFDHIKNKNRKAKKKSTSSNNANANDNTTEDSNLNKEKIWHIINNDIYPSKANLTHQEKAYLKKIKNRITAQKSRDKMKDQFELFKQSNESLNKEIADKEDTITLLKTIISSCPNCSDRVNRSSFVLPSVNSNDLPIVTITQTNNGSNLPSLQFLSVGIGSIIGIVCCVLLLFSFQSSATYNTILRNLIGNDKEENLIKFNSSLIDIDYNSVNSNSNQCCPKEDEQDEFYEEQSFLKSQVNNQKSLNTVSQKAYSSIDFLQQNQFLCKEDVIAKLSNQLNFHIINNQKKRAQIIKETNSAISLNNTDANSNTSKPLFKMIIPSFKYQNTLESYIIELDSMDYLKQIDKLTQYTYYEVICEIVNVTKVIYPNK